uniref:Uncharacterized protein n=1 Tax=Clytia hemisphaerica TaxID=252671 RepID=A0A7M5V1J7_9CNID
MAKDLADVGQTKQSPEEIKEQLDKLKDLEDELSQTRPSVAALQDASDWLVDNNSDDKVTAGNIKGRYGSIATPLSELADKINEKQNKLQQALMKTQAFEDIFTNAVDQLEELNMKMDRFEPLSVKHNNLRKQDDEFKAYETDFNQLKPIFEEMTKSVKDARDTMEDPTEKEKLMKKVKDVIAKRVDLGKRVQARREDIDQLSPLAADQDKAEDVLKPELTSLEEQCDKVKDIPQTLPECEKQAKEVEKVLKNIEEASPKHKDLNETFAKEMEKAKELPKVSDEPILTAEVDQLNKRWDDLEAKAKDKEDQVKQLKDKFQDFEDARKPVDEELSKLENILDQQQPFRLDEDLGKKNLEDIEALIKELEDAEKGVENVKDKGKDLEDTLDGFEADSKPIEEDVTDIDDRLKNLKDKLKDRKDILAKQLDDLVTFKDTEKETEASLNDLTDEQENLEPISTEPEKIKEQLAEVQKMLDEVDGCKPKVVKLKETAEDVCQNNPGDFSVASQTALDAKKVEEPLERLEFKLNDRKNKLENLLVGTQELQDTIDDFNDKLLTAEKALDKMKPISARYPIAKKQQATTDALVNQINELEPNLKTLENAADKVIREADPKEAERVQKKIDDLKDRYQKAKDIVKAKQDVVEKVVPLAKNFEEVAEPLQEFITEAEKELAPVTDDLPAEKPLLNSEIDKLKNLKKLINDQEPVYESFIASEEPLVEAAESDTEKVNNEVATTKDRWEKLNVTWDERLDNLQGLKDKVNEIDEIIEPVEEAVVCCEQVVDNLAPIGLDKDKGHEQIDELEKLLDDLDSKEDDLKKAEELTDKLAEQPGVDVLPLKKKTADVKDKHDKTKEKVKDKKDKLNKYIIYIEEYYEIIEEITEFIYVTKSKPDLIDPIATDPKRIKEQIAGVEAIQDEVVEKKPKLERVTVIIEYITIECPDDVTVVSEVQTKYDQVKKPFDETAFKVDVRMKRLRDTLAQSQKFQESFDDFLDRLSHAEERLSHEKPVSAKLDTVKEQKAEHDQVHNDIVQLEPTFAQICTSADEVLEEADPGEEKDQLKAKIDEVKERYEKMKDDSEKRDKVLADEVKFTQTFDDQHKPFADWLDEIEPKLKNLKPLPCEEDSIQRQVKEAKEASKEIEEQKPKLEDMEKTAQDALDIADVDKIFIEEDVKADRTRYDELKADCDGVEKKLDELLPLAKDYKKEMKPVDEVLDKVEKVVGVAQSPLGLDEDKIKEEKEMLEDLAKELEETKPKLDKFNETAKDLQDKADPESTELPALKKDVDEINDRYDKLKDLLQERRDKLDDYADKVDKFNKSDTDFNNWLNEAQKTPGVIEPIGTEPEVLKRQLKEVEAVREEIVQKKPLLEEQKENGDWLDENSPQDSALHDDVDEKVEKNQDQNDGFATKVDIRYQRLQRALMKSQEFEKTFADFAESLDDLDQRLDNQEPLTCSYEPLKKIKEQHEEDHECATAIVFHDSDSDQDTDNFEFTDPKTELLRQLDTMVKYIVTPPGSPTEKTNLKASKTTKNESTDNKNYCSEVHVFNYGRLNSNIVCFLPKSCFNRGKPLGIDKFILFIKRLAEKDLEAKEPIYERILQNGNSLLDETEPGPERDAVQQKLDDLTDKWNGVKEKADKRTDDLGRLLPLAQTHNDNYVTFSVYLNGAEKKLNGFKQPEMDPEELERQKKELEEFRKEVESKKPLHTDYNNTNDPIYITCKQLDITRGVPELNDEVDATNGRWDKLNADLDDRQKELDEANKKLDELDEKLKPISELVDDVQKLVKDPVTVGSDVEKGKEAKNNVDKLKKDLDEKKPSLESVINEIPEIKEKVGEEGVKPIEEKCTALQTQMDECEQNLDDMFKALDDQIDHGQGFNDACEELKKWLPEAEESPAIVEPISSDPEEILKQIEDVKALEEDIVAKRPLLEKAQENAKWLLDANKNDPEKCAQIADQLTSVALPFQELVDKLDDKQKRLATINKALENYQKEKVPLEELIEATEQKVDHLEPVNLDLEKDEAELKELEDLLSNLEKRKPDLRAVNRAGQALIRQLDSPDDIEKDLDRLSDKYYETVDKTKDKLGEQKDSVNKIKHFIEIIEILEIWIVETYIVIEKIDTGKTDPEDVKKEMETIQDTRIDLRKHMPQLKEAEEIGQWCAENLDDAVKPVVEERLEKVKTPMEETIPEKLDDLEGKLGTSLASTKQFNEDVDDLNKFLNKMNNTVENQKPISADKDPSKRQLNEQQYLLEEVDSKEPELEKVLKQGNELVESTPEGDERKALEDKVDSIKNDWDDLKKKMNDRKDKIEDVNKLANQLDDKKSKDIPSLEDIEKKADQLDAISADPEELAKQDETCKELLDDFTEKKPLYEDILKDAESLVEKAETDKEPVQEDVDKMKQRLVDDEEKLNKARDKVDRMKSSLDDMDKKKKPVEDLCDQAEELLDNTPPFGDDLPKADEQIAALQDMLDKMEEGKPMVDSMDKAGDDVIGVDENPDNVTTVKQLTDDLDKTYDDRVEKLKEKIDKLKKDKETAEKFNDKLKASEDTIKPVQEKLDNLEPVGATPEKVKEQLVECEEMQAVCQEADNLFNEADELGKELLEANDNKPEVEEPVKEKLKAVEEPIEDCKQKLDDREKKLKDQLQECGAFQDQIDDFLRRINNLDDKIGKHDEEPLSMKEGPAAVALEELKAIKKDLDEEAPIFDQVMENGRKLLDSIESPEEKEALKSKLDDTEKAWNDVQKKMADDLAKEEDVTDKTKSLDDKIADLEKKLDDQEKKLRDLDPVSCDPEQLDQQQKETNGLQNDNKLYKEALDDLEKLKSELDPVCKKDVEEVEERIQKLKDHLAECEGLGDARQAKISDIQDKVQKFNTDSRPVKDKLTKLEKGLADQNLIGADKPRVLEVQDEINKLLKQAEELEPKVDDLDKICKDLLEQHPTTDSKHLRDEADEIKDRLEKLKAKIASKKDEVDDIANDWDKMEEDVAKALDTVKKANNCMEENKPKKLDVEELPIQVENIKAVEAELDESAPVFDDLQKRGRKLREKGIGDDTIGDQLEKINDKLNDIQKEIPTRVGELENLKNVLDDFNNKLDDTDNDMKDVEEKVADQSPVGGDKETIDKQMTGLKDLADELDKLQGKVKDLNDIRSDLKSQYPNADSSKVDEPLDALNDRFNDLNQGVSDRQSKLEDALVQCGQLDDAIKSMLKWLEDTGEIVDSQKPIAAADKNVLKEQINGHKFLTRMFDDREPSVQNLNKTGDELLATTEDEDKKAEIRADLDKVNEMFGDLKGKVDDRAKKLDETLVAAEKFNKDFDDVQAKLDELQKKIDSGENVPSAEPEKVDEQLENIKPVFEECQELAPLLEDIQKDLADLEEYCTPEDAETLHDKVNKLNNKADKVTKDCQKKEHNLEDARDLLKDLKNKDKEFNDWADKTKEAIEELKANPDPAAIKELQKDIVAHKDDVEKMKDLGKDLKKIVKPEEYPTVKDLVDADDEKYKALKADMDETARDAFMNKEKLEAFEGKLADLKKWTDDKLDHYRVIEPVAVEADKIKEQIGTHNGLTAEVNGKEPEFKDFYEMGATILAACNEDEAPAVKEKIESLKHNKQKVNKETTERQEALVEALILAQQFADVHKDVTTRLTNTENLLSQVDEEKGRGVEMQKEKLQNIEDNIKQLQPLIASIQKTGGDLIKLSGPGQGSDGVQKKIDECLERWEQLKLSSEEKGITVGAAAVQVEAVWNDLEDLIEKTQAIKEDIKKQEPVPVYEEPILEEIKKLEEQEATIKDIEDPYQTVNERVDEVLKTDPTSPASKALKDKQRKLNNNWTFITNGTRERRNSLEETKEAAEKFWPGLEKIKDTLLDVQTKLDDEGEPGLNPESVDEMLKEHEDIHQELDSNGDVITTLSEVTPVLVGHASHENKIGVHKMLSEVTDEWDNVETAWTKRKDDLEHIKAMISDFSKAKETVDDWLSEQEDVAKAFQEVPSDKDALRDQLRKLRTFHRDLIKNQSKITKVDQQGLILAEKINDDDSQQLSDDLVHMKKRWDDLLDTSYDHQHNLEDSLIQSGQFGVAIEELLAWIEQTKVQLTTEEQIPRRRN